MNRTRRGGVVSRLLTTLVDDSRKVEATPAPTAASAKAATPLTEDEKKLKEREHRLAELLSTERTYVQHMATLDELYIQPLLTGSEKGTLSQKFCDILFHNIRSIRDLNKKLLSDLESSKEGKIGHLFVAFAPFFQFYKDYIANHVKANRLVKDLLGPQSPSPSFRAFHGKCITDPRAKGLNMLSLLVTPIQRVPRYRMLLTEIIKSTPADHADKKELDVALELIEKAAEEINEAVRQLESIEELEDIQKNDFDGKIQLVRSGQTRCYFIRRGQLKKVCRSVDKEYTFFLFSDLLVYGAKDAFKTTYKISNVIPIDRHFEIKPNSGSSRLLIRRDTGSSAILGLDEDREESVFEVVEEDEKDRPKLPTKDTKQFTPKTKTIVSKVSGRRKASHAGLSRGYSTSTLDLSASQGLRELLEEKKRGSTADGKSPDGPMIETPKASDSASGSVSPSPSPRMTIDLSGVGPEGSEGKKEETPKAASGSLGVEAPALARTESGDSAPKSADADATSSSILSPASPSQRRISVSYSDTPSRLDSRLDSRLRAGSTAVSRPYSWTILNSVKSFVVYAATEKDMKEWMEDMQECVELAKARETSDEKEEIQPVWVNDRDTDACRLCTKKWTVTNRRHHCRRCGELICGSCSKGQMVLPTSNGKKVRVCTQCEGEEIARIKASLVKTKGKDGTPATSSPSPPGSPGSDGREVSSPGSPVSPDSADGSPFRRSLSTPEEAAKQHLASIKEGMLRKCGGRVKSWKERFCVLMGDELLYYKKKGDKAPQGVIKLDINTSVRREEEETARGYVFAIRPSQLVKEKDQNRIYLIAAASEEERLAWMTAIEAQIKTARAPWEALTKTEIRTGPSADCAATGFLEKGDIIQVTEVQGYWVHHAKGWSQLKEDGKFKLQEMIVVRKGFLQKEGSRMSSNWHNYFFVLYTHKLLYFHNINDREHKAIEITREGTVESRHGGAKPHTFAVVPAKKGKLLILAASSKEEKAQWMVSFKKVITGES